MDPSALDLENLKCYICDKYLSVPPLLIYTTPTGEDQNVCGRCEIPENGRVVQNVSFETLAKCIKFPCSVSTSCQKKLVWGEAKKHEEKCPHREIPCSICESSFSVSEILSHFQQFHKDKLFYNNGIINKNLENTPFTTTILIQSAKVSYLAHIEVDDSNRKLTIKVEPVSSTSTQHLFSVTFSTKNHSVSFKNNPIGISEGDPRKKIDMEPVLNILTLDDTEFKIEIYIHRNQAGESSGKRQCI